MLAVVGFIYGGGSFAAAWVLTAPWRLARTPVARERWSQATVETEDGIEIVTYRRPAPGPAVVLAHGYHGRAGQMAPLGEALADRGFDVLLLDFRGHGESGGKVVGAGALEARDLSAVLGRLRDQRGSLNDVAVVGLSMGAAAAVQTPEVAEVGALVLVGCYASLEQTWNARCRKFLGPFSFLAGGIRWFAERRVGIALEDVQPIRRLAGLKGRPILLLHGRSDWRIGPEAPLRLQQASQGRLVWHPGDHLALGRLGEDARLREPILEFLAEWRAAL